MNELESFAAQRDVEMRGIAAGLEHRIRRVLDGEHDAEDLTTIATTTFRGLGADEAMTQRFLSDIDTAIDRTTEESSPTRVATWMATAMVNALVEYGPTPGTKTWVTMFDEDVRELHQPLHGEQRQMGETFTVGATPTLYPGQPIGPIENWINCRCVLHVRPPLITAGGTMSDIGTITTTNGISFNTSSDVHEYEDELADITEPIDMSDDEPMPWYSVLTVEGVRSGDKRGFDRGALSWRDLPLPLEWQRQTGPGHDGSVIVGRIDGIQRHDNQLRAWGVFVDNQDADDAVGLVGELALRGISPTVDSHEASFDDETGEETLSKGRICSGTLVNVPAFAEAYLRLGHPPEDWGVGGESPLSEVALAADAGAGTPEEDALAFIENMEAESDYFRDFPTKKRRSMAKAGTAMPDGSYPIANLEDLRNAIQAIGRAKNPAAVKRHIKKRARALGHSDLIPEGWSLDEPEDFRRGAGWVTHPRETARLHRYWTKGPGAAKIGWGSPHDFYRCRRQLAKYIGPRFLSRTCAQWHHDALGYWPGQPPHAADTESYGECTDCGKIALVATAALATKIPPAEWFRDPQLTGPTPLTVDRDGRLYGHLATWGTCHIGFDGECVEPPHSSADYAYFHTGVVETSDGELPIGVLTMDTGHADLGHHHKAAVQHYDNTGVQVARVRAGEDAYGIWVAGQALPVGEGDFARFRAGALSGDWRRIAGGLELIAALAVNTPGFPIPRMAIAASAGVRNALVAANVVRPVENFSPDAVADAVIRRLRDDERRVRRAAALRARVNGPRAAALLASVEGKL